MRTTLQGLVGSKRQFIAVFEEYGIFIGKDIVGRTIRLSSLSDSSGRELATHVWINYTGGFDVAGEFEKGDIVTFEARIRGYMKGYCWEEIDKRLQSSPSMDYFLAFPRNVQRIGKREQNISIEPQSSKRKERRRGPTAPLKKHNGVNSYLPELGMKRRIVLGVC